MHIDPASRCQWGPTVLGATGSVYSLFLHPVLLDAERGLPFSEFPSNTDADLSSKEAL